MKQVLEELRLDGIFNCCDNTGLISACNSVLNSELESNY